MQVIGIDVGGTNTDATLIGPDWNAAGIVKTPTEHDNILASTKLAFNEILKYLEDDVPVQLHLSTTLSTNAIIEGKGEPVAVVAIPGPGVNPAAFGFDFPIYPVQGYVDHRGRVVEDVDPEEVLTAARNARANGARALAVVGKFSQRNNRLELAAADAIRQAGLGFDQITLGHQLSGRLNFPRRIVSAF